MFFWQIYVYVLAIICDYYDRCTETRWCLVHINVLFLFVGHDTCLLTHDDRKKITFWKIKICRFYYKMFRMQIYITEVRTETDFTVSSTTYLCKLNLCKPNTCLNQANSSVRNGFGLDRFCCIYYGSMDRDWDTYLNLQEFGIWLFRSSLTRYYIVLHFSFTGNN